MTSEGLFSVFIERARSEAPDAAAKLAQAMASHYGIDATAVEQRLAIGRFRVKGAVDRATADSFAADLTKLGAIVNVEPASDVTPPPSAGPAGKAKRNRTPPTGVKIPPAVSLQQPRVAAPAPKVPAIAPVGTPRPMPAPVRAPTPAPVAAPVRAPTPAPVAAPVRTPTPAPIAAPVRTPTPAPVRAPMLAPVAAAPEPAPRPSQPQFTSGLAAAKKSDGDALGGLGALGGDMPLSLSTLDGEDDHELSASRNVGLPASFGPPPDTARGRVPAPAPDTARGRIATPAPVADPTDEVDVAMDDDDDDGDLGIDTSMLDDAGPLPASIGPAASPRDLGGPLPASIGPAASPRDLGGTNDMFAPPDAGEDIALALDVEPVRKKPAPAPPPVMSHDPPPPVADDRGRHGHAAAANERISTQQQVPRVPGEPAWKTYGKDERVRFVAGVVLAAALGCVPALIAHSVRERSAFADIDTRLQQQQSQVLTRADWDNLDRVRASFVEKKKAERTSIAVTSLLLWVAVSGAVAFVWFRKVDWDRLFGR